MTIKQLLKSGYAEYDPDPRFQNCKRFFQKRIRDKKGTKYFINVEYYDFPIHGKPHKGFEFVLHYEKDNYNLSARFFSNKNLEEMEKILEEFFIKNEFNYYELD